MQQLFSLLDRRGLLVLHKRNYLLEHLRVSEGKLEAEVTFYHIKNVRLRPLVCLHESVLHELVDLLKQDLQVLLVCEFDEPLHCKIRVLTLHHGAERLLVLRHGLRRDDASEQHRIALVPIQLKELLDDLRAVLLQRELDHIVKQTDHDL